MSDYDLTTTCVRDEDGTRMVRVGYGNEEVTDFSGIEMELIHIISEHQPSVCEDSGEAEWSVGEARQLAKALILRFPILAIRS